VWAAVLLHGVINGSAGAFTLFAKGGHPLVASPVGIAGLLAIALLIVSTALVDRSRINGAA
jgi:hypothetical protein